jgi:signal transduction histidine kinase/ActR/RegA family two-component response regulator
MVRAVAVVGAVAYAGAIVHTLGREGPFWAGAAVRVVVAAALLSVAFVPAFRTTPARLEAATLAAMACVVAGLSAGEAMFPQGVGIEASLFVLSALAFTFFVPARADRSLTVSAALVPGALLQMRYIEGAAWGATLSISLLVALALALGAAGKARMDAMRRATASNLEGERAARAQAEAALSAYEQAQAQVARGNLLFGAVFDGAPVGLLLTRLATGEILQANRHVVGLLDADDAGLGDSIAPYYEAPEERAALRSALLADGRAERIVQAVTRTGRHLSIRVSAERLRLAGEDLVVSSLVDLTEDHRRARALVEARAEAELASRAKSMFLANMSHEIRTPMNGVLGMAEILRGTPLSSEQSELLRTLETSGQALLRIINDILDHTKIEADRLDLDTRPFALRAMLTDLHALLTPRAREKGVAYLAEVDEDVPDAVIGDAHRVRQVLTNLIGNAIKFTRQGEVRCRVRLEEATEAGMLLAFVVSDTGVGLDVADVERLFEPFSQADLGTAREFGGTGLGLAISRRLAEMMGGAVTATGVRGEGATFTFTARFEPALPGAIPLCAARPAEGTRPRAGLRVLLAEDNVVNQRVSARFLEQLGVEYAIAQHGQAALEALQQGPFDVVLMDVQMPRLDGLSAVRRLRAEERERGGHQVVIAMTAHALDGDRALCLDAGMDDYLSKPITQAALARALVRWTPVPARGALVAVGVRESPGARLARTPGGSPPREPHPG